jgi:hypothetical protein
MKKLKENGQIKLNKNKNKLLILFPPIKSNLAMSLKGAFGKKTTTSKTENVDENKKKKLKIEKDKYNFNLLSPTERTEHVKEKIINASREDPKNVDEIKLGKVAAKLAEEDGIKEAYLNKSFKSAMEYFQMVPKEKKRKSTLISGVESIPTSDSKNMEEEEEEEIFEDEPDIFLKTNEKIKIKLVITEIAKNNKDKTIRKILSPFASTFDISPQCGKNFFLIFKRNVSLCTFRWSLVFGMDKQGFMYSKEMLLSSCFNCN